MAPFIFQKTFLHNYKDLTEKKAHLIFSKYKLLKRETRLKK